MLNSRSRKGAGQCERMHSPAFLSRLRGEMERPDPPRPGVPLFWIRFCAGRRIASRPFPHSAKTVTCPPHRRDRFKRSEEHTSELQSLMRISYAVFCLKTKHNIHTLQLTSLI